MLFIFSKKEGTLKTLEVLLASKKPVCFNSEQDLLSKKEDASLIIVDEDAQLIPKLFGKTVLFLSHPEIPPEYRQRLPLLLKYLPFLLLQKYSIPEADRALTDKIRSHQDLSEQA